MLILSPDDRAVLWRRTVTSPPDEREGMLRVLALAMQDVVAGGLEVYDVELDERFAETLRLLDRSGLIGSDELRRDFEVVGIDDPHERRVEAREFVLTLAGLLEESASRDSLDGDERLAALHAAGHWRQLVEDGTGPLPEQMLSVADVASHFGVTPQAVYKWIDSDKIEFERTPGGSYRIPAGQFDLAWGRDGPDRRRAIRERLLARHGSVEVDDEELARAIRKARQGA